MKKWDKIIIISLIGISFVPQIIFNWVVIKDYNKAYAVVSIEGKTYKKLPLTGQVEMKEYVIKTKYGTNLIVIENEKVAIREADCPDKICTEPGFIDKPGQSLVCLPHKVLVKIEGVMETDSEIDIKSY